MKTLIFLLILFCIIASPAFAALTDADLDKIRLIVKEEVKKEIESSEARMKIYIDTKIEAVNTKIEAVNTKIEAVNTKVDGVEKRLTTRIDAVNSRIDSVEKQMTFLLNVIYGLIALIIVAIGIPQVIIGWRSRRDSSLENRVEILTQEIEALKRQHIVKP